VSGRLVVLTITVSIVSLVIGKFDCLSMWDAAHDFQSLQKKSYLSITGHAKAIGLYPAIRSYYPKSQECSLQSIPLTESNELYLLNEPI
jgi:hypothetical protein